MTSLTSTFDLSNVIAKKTDASNLNNKMNLLDLDVAVKDARPRETFHDALNNVKSPVREPARSEPRSTGQQSRQAENRPQERSQRDGDGNIGERASDTRKPELARQARDNRGAGEHNTAVKQTSGGDVEVGEKAEPVLPSEFVPKEGESLLPEGLIDSEGNILEAGIEAESDSLESGVIVDTAVLVGETEAVVDTEETVLEGEELALETVPESEVPITATLGAAIESVEPEAVGSRVAGDVKIDDVTSKSKTAPAHKSLSAGIAMPEALATEGELTSDGEEKPISRDLAQLAMGKSFKNSDPEAAAAKREWSSPLSAGSDLAKKTEPSELMLSAEKGGVSSKALEPNSLFGGMQLSLQGKNATNLGRLAQEPSQVIPGAQKPATGTPVSAVGVSMPTSTVGTSGADKITIPVNIRLGSPKWAGQIAERTAWMAAQKLSTAEIQLDPPELGPLAVKVTMQNEQASVAFVSGNPAVREALDQSQAKLRELFDNEGMDLVDVDVSDQSQESSEENEDDASDALPQGDANTSEESIAASVELSTGVDHFV